MKQPFSLLIFTGILIGGVFAIFTFGDILISTFASDSEYTDNTKANSISVVTDNEENFFNSLESESSQDIETNLDSSTTTENPIVDKNKEIITKDQTTSDACPESTALVDLDLEKLSRTHSILSSYVPSSLVSIKGDWGTYCIKNETEKALQKMISDAKKEGLVIQIYSGYRSYSLQSILFSRWQKNNPGGADYPAVAEPGHSEHQLGTTVDLKSGSIPYGSDNPFGDSPEYPWMKENAHKYGFTQSYKKGVEEITGYIAEPWHWRYVGVDIATKIKKKETTFTEYVMED